MLIYPMNITEYLLSQGTAVGAEDVAGDKRNCHPCPLENLHSS